MLRKINGLVSKTFTLEQKSGFKLERNKDLTFIVIIIDIDWYENNYRDNFLGHIAQPWITYTAISSRQYEHFLPLQDWSSWTGWRRVWWLMGEKGRMDTHGVVGRVADAIFQNRSAAPALNRGVRGAVEKDGLPHDQLSHLFTFTPESSCLQWPSSSLRSNSSYLVHYLALGWASQQERKLLL